MGIEHDIAWRCTGVAAPPVLSAQGPVHHVSLNRGVRYSIFPALLLSGYIAVRVIEGSIDGADPALSLHSSSEPSLPSSPTEKRSQLPSESCCNVD